MNSSVTKPAQPKSLPKRVFNNQPIPGKKFTQPQSQYDNVPIAPFRQLLYANTASGKTTLILNQCLDLYRNVFERIIVFSHSWDTDSTWDPLKKYMEEKEWNIKECGFSTYDDAVLAKIIDEQAQVTRYLKSKGSKCMGILIILDDMMDSRAAMRGKQIEILYARGRHIFCSVITSLQSVRKVSTVVRQQSEHILCWRLKSSGDLDSFLEENSAIVPMQTLQEIYWKAVSKPYGYLCLNKTATDDDDLFHPDGLATPGEKIT